MPVPAPQSNVEKYLSVIAGHSTEVPSEPTSRVEYYLAEIVKNGGIGGKLKPRPVSALPATGESGILYLVPVQETSGQNTHDEYIWVEEETKYELLGQAKIEINLSDYALKSELPTIPTNVSAFQNDSGYLTNHQDISGKVDKETGKGLSTNDFTTAEKNKLSDIDQYANKTLIDDTLSNAGQAADAKAAGDALSALRAETAVFREYFANMEVYRTTSGNPATFNDGYPANVKALSVTLAPTQEGEGVPYPPGGMGNLLEMYVGDFNGKQNFTYSLEDPVNNAVTCAHSTSNSAFFAKFLAHIPEAGTYTISWDDATLSKIGIQLAFYSDDLWGSNVGASPTVINLNRVGETDHASATFDFPGVWVVGAYISGSGGQVSVPLSVSNLQIEAGESRSEFVPYSNIRPISGATSVRVTRTGENGANAQSVTVPLVDSNDDPLPVYGGTLDVTTGTLSVTWNIIASYNGETLPGRWISDRDAYSAGTSPTTGAQVAYELATPVTYQLDPAQIAALSGYNSVSADAGTLEVRYRADPSLSSGGAS